MASAIQGQVESGFEAVEQAFADNFSKRGELGASVSAWVDGRKVVDLWGGIADRQTKRPWEEDDLCVMFSVTKGLVAVCMLMLADRGKLDYDAPVAGYWPGFAQGGKERISVRQLMNHRSGLCAIDGELSLDDLEKPERMVSALEEQEPLWPPGTGQGYHGISYGLYVGELFRRIQGETVGQFFAREVAAPLGLDLHIGFKDSDKRSVATLYPVGSMGRLTKVIPTLVLGIGAEGSIYRGFLNKQSATRRAFQNPPALTTGGLSNFNLPRVRAMELLWANALGNARGLAKLYGALAIGGELDGRRLVTEQALLPLQKRQSWAVDKVLHKQLGWTQGFVKEEPHLYSPNIETYGHTGAGGSIGFADPVAGVGFGYVMNQMDYRLRSPRCLALARAVYSCL